MTCHNKPGYDRSVSWPSLLIPQSDAPGMLKKGMKETPKQPLDMYTKGPSTQLPTCISVVPGPDQSLLCSLSYWRKYIRCYHLVSRESLNDKINKYMSNIQPRI